MYFFKKIVSITIVGILASSIYFSSTDSQVHAQTSKVSISKNNEEVSISSTRNHLKGLETGAGAIAKSLGYSRTNYYSMGQRVYKSNKNKNPIYITRDNGSHIGGYWKGARTVKDLARKETRSGTYDKNLRRLGD